MSHLKQLLFPEVRIDLPNRAGQRGYAEQAERLKILDHNQESLARQFDGGHRIIVGASGSGKTLVLAHKAGFLQRYNPAIKSILFVCYNITLVNFVKRILAGKGIPIGEAGVTVCHFYELCSWITGESIPYEKEDNAFYEMVAQEALSKVGSYAKRFDAILVDEGQDFTPEMFKVVTGLLNATTNNLTIALDDNQNIYRPKAQWKELGIQARGWVHKLTSVYRNTSEIAGFAARFMGTLLIKELPEHPSLRKALDALSMQGTSIIVTPQIVQEATDHISRAHRTFKKFGDQIDRFSPAMADANLWHAVVRGYYY